MLEVRPRVKKEHEFHYVNKFNNKEFRFEPADDEVVATFDSERTDSAVHALSFRATSTPSTLRPDQGFAILRLGHEETSEAAVASLDAEPEVANALPVMTDPEGCRRYFLPDELTVQFADGVEEEKARKILAERKLEIVVEQRTPGYFTVAVPEGQGLFETLRELSEVDEVAFAEPSEVGVDDLLEEAVPAEYEPFDFTESVGLEEGLAEADLEATSGDELALPSDTFFGRLWGLHNTGQTVDGDTGLVDADIDAPQAWTITQGTRQVVVAVIDTGADLDHPDLAPNLLPRGSEDWDFGDPGDDVPWDSHGHGTHVAGTVAAVRNSQGVVGVAPKVWVMPLRVDLTSGKNANRADAINYVAGEAQANPSRRYVINCSWKMSGDHAGVHSAIQKAVAKNVVVVFAAGNANQNIDVTPQYPAVYPEVIAVAATDQRDERAWFSNYGGKVDVSAPGVNVYSTVPNNTYGFLDGTSMASPHVAGLAGLVWSRNPSLSNAQVRSLIEATCDNIDARNPGFVGKLGKGRINAYRALRATPPPRLSTRLLRKFRFPQKNAGSSTGLAFAPRFPFRLWGWRPALLFLTQQAGSERVYFLNPSTGAVGHTVDPTANDTIGSLDWDGSALRVANVTTGAGSINRIHPTTGAQIGTLPAPAGRGEGLAVAGGWIFYSTINRIYIIRASTGAVVRSYPPPGGACRSLTYGRGWLFAGNSQTGIITVFNPWTRFVRGTIQVPGSGTNRAEGIAFDSARRTLFVANQSENRIYALGVAV